MKNPNSRNRNSQDSQADALHAHSAIKRQWKEKLHKCNKGLFYQLTIIKFKFFLKLFTASRFEVACRDT